LASQLRRVVVTGGGGQAANLENINGGTADDILLGNAAANQLLGNGGDDVLVGRDGNDKLYGDGGRDILIGGQGADLVRGGPQQDLLIAAGLKYEANVTGLTAIHNEWTQSTPFADRVDHLLGNTAGANGNFTLAATDRVADTVADSLFGDDDQDWFLAAKTEAKDFKASQSDRLDS
jgi:Ca2+-binding RTX toxin-like protein